MSLAAALIERLSVCVLEAKVGREGEEREKNRERIEGKGVKKGKEREGGYGRTGKGREREGRKRREEGS